MSTETKVAPIELVFWWVPQVPMKAFRLPIDSIRDGRLLETAFAKYDLFQLENRIKPDFCNAGGISFRHPELTEGVWWGVPSDSDELDDIIAEASKRGIEVWPLVTA